METVRQIAESLKSGARCVLVRGAAGTGKTTMISSLIPIIRQMRFAPILIAPTGRAAKMLSMRTGEKCSTIHSCIYSPPSEPTYEESLEVWVWKFSLKHAVPADSVIIVDESSMVGQAVQANESLRFGSGSLLRDLVQWAGLKLPQCRNKIVFVGDPYQLPPVGERVQIPPALDPANLAEILGERPKVFDLTTVYRQGGNSGILAEAMELRHRMSSGCFGEYVCREHDDVQIVTRDALESRYRPQEKIDNKIIIAQTNLKVWQYNALVRRLLGISSFLPQAGERLLSLRNTIVGNAAEGGSVFTNGDILQVVEDCGKEFRLDGFYHIPNSDETLHFPFLFRQMTVAWPYEPNRADATVWLNITPIVSEEWRQNDAYASTALFTSVMASIRKRFKGQSKEDLAQKVADSALLHAPIVTFGYALTVHKAQGGEWDDVWVDYQYAQSQRSEDYFRWAYTATTRARKRLYAIEPPRMDDLLEAIDRAIERRSDEDGANPRGESTTLRLVLERFGLMPLNRVVQNWAYRVYVASKGDPSVELGNITVGYNGKNKVSHVLPRIVDLSEDLLQALRSLTGASVQAVLELGSGEKVVAREDVQPMHAKVVSRIKAATDGKLVVLSYRSLTDHQLRVEMRTRLGDGYVDWYFDGKGRVTEMGNATVPLDVLKQIREELSHA